MKEIKWRSFDEPPTVSDPEKKIFAEEAKELYLTLLHQKLKERVVSGEISQAEMDWRFIKYGVNFPNNYLFQTEELKKHGIEKITISRADVELVASLMADTVDVEVLGKSEKHDKEDPDKLN